MLRIKDILKKVLVYSWLASPMTFILLMMVSLVFCVIKFLEVAIFEKLVEAVTHVYNGQDIEVLLPSIIALSAILILTPIIELIEFLVRGYFWRRGHGYMQGLFHKRIGKKPLIDFEDNNAFDQMKKARLGSSETPNNIRILIQILFLYMPFFAVVAYYLFTINPILMLVLLLIFIPLLLAEITKMNDNYEFENRVANIRRRMTYFEKCMTDKVHFKETLQNDAYNFFSTKLLLSIHDFTTKHKKVYFKAFKIEAAMNSINILGYLGVITLLIVFLANGEISISEFAAVYYAVDKITTMLKRLITDVGEVMEELATTSFLLDFLEDKPQNKCMAVVSKKVDIHLENLTFYYPNTRRPAVSEVSLTIPIGTSLAIVGENGSGKSTLSKLIMGLYQPHQGKVSYGLQDINDYANDDKFDNVSAVFQDFSKYKLAVDENIKMSDTQSKYDVKEAIEKSNFNLSKLANKETTILSREFGGQDLSGGEWQRLAIARGLYRQHDIIVLDEPTAAIDPIEEEHVFSTFRKASQDKTSILVTHRLGSVQFADMIAVMDDGKLVEVGTHDQLINQKGKYSELFVSQAKWYKRA
ncbi:MAG: ABC transporter ATP-binding protein [Clostridiales bacterium]|nr:ABC transporter ATP-binding protein [Clostridiales bacterium]